MLTLLNWFIIINSNVLSIVKVLISLCYIFSSLILLISVICDYVFSLLYLMSQIIIKPVKINIISQAHCGALTQGADNYSENSLNQQKLFTNELSCLGGVLQDEIS